MSRMWMVTAIALLIPSAAALSSPPEKQPPKVPVPAADAAKLAGTYTQVGPFRTDLTLRPDGCYVASVQWGLLPSGDAVGNWRVTGKTLILTPFWHNELGREWFPHMNPMHIVRQGGYRFVFLRRCDVAAVQTEPDLPVYCFLLHLWSFKRTDQLNVPVNFVGRYYRGDGLGSNHDLVLKADGTYTVESYACMGKSGDASGTWHVSGKTLTLSPVKATGNINFAKTLDVVERDGRAVFVEPDMRADFKKYGVRYSYWCFKRTDYPAK